MAYLPRNLEPPPAHALAGPFTQIPENPWTPTHFEDARAHGWFVYAGHSTRGFTIRATARSPDAQSRAQAAKEAFQNTPATSIAKKWVLKRARAYMTQEARRKVGIRLERSIKPRWMSTAEFRDYQ